MSARRDGHDRIWNDSAGLGLLPCRVNVVTHIVAFVKLRGATMWVVGVNSSFGTIEMRLSGVALERDSEVDQVNLANRTHVAGPQEIPTRIKLTTVDLYVCNLAAKCHFKSSKQIVE